MKKYMTKSRTPLSDKTSHVISFGSGLVGGASYSAMKKAPSKSPLGNLLLLGGYGASLAATYAARGDQDKGMHTLLDILSMAGGIVTGYTLGK